MSLLILAQATGGGSLGCGNPPQRPIFIDAFDFVVKQRESVSGGVCIGGPKEILDLAATHLLISFIAVAIAVLISVPLGLYLGHKGKGEFMAISASNVGRAVPSLALLAFFVAFVGVGYVNVILVLTLLAIPPILTNAYVGVQQVDRDLVGAARGMGLTESQIIRQVELPLAMPTVFAGLRTSAVAVVATATIAPLANVQSLGTPIITPQTYGLAGQIGAALVVALITLVIDAGLGRAQRLSTPKGLTINERGAKRRRFAFLTPRTES